MAAHSSATGDAGHGSVLSYTIGFVLSVALTILAYILVVNHVFHNGALTSAIMGLAVLQFAVQMIFFLHLGRESKPHWNFTVMLFMLLVLFIVVFGSLWIMNNLNYNMTPQDTNDYILQDEEIPKTHLH